ncbi:MFS transporter [Homoserinimonas sp. A520]
MPSTQHPLPVWAGRSVVLVGIILVALSLRTAVGALSPIFGEIDADLPLTSIRIGLLGTLPPLLFAIFGLLTPLLRRRLRLETLLLVALVVMTLTHVWRGTSGSYLSLAVASGVAFAAVGVANVVLPPIVKKYFPDRIGGVTSLYVTCMTFFSMVPALVAVPVADGFGWRVSVGMWAALAAVAVIPWIALVRRREPRSADSAERDDVATPALVGSVWSSRLAWALAVFFGMTSINIFGMFAWLPEILLEVTDITPATGGALLAVYAGMGVPLAVVVPVLAVRRGSAGPLTVAGCLLYAGGYLGLLLAPGALTVLWVVVAGLGAMHFPLALVLINLRTRTHQGAIALSGFTQGMGYLIGALGPVMLGILRDLTGGWTVPILFLISTVVGMAISGAVLLRPRMFEDEWATSKNRGGTS